MSRGVSCYARASPAGALHGPGTHRAEPGVGSGSCGTRQRLMAGQITLSRCDQCLKLSCMLRLEPLDQLSTVEWATWGAGGPGRCRSISSALRMMSRAIGPATLAPPCPCSTTTEMA
jgi:hypothetical protein